MTHQRLTAPVRIMGVDPGGTGAVAILQAHPSPDVECLLEGVWAAPKTPTGRADLVNALRPDRIILEGVHAMPGDGKVGAFTFGRDLGWWEGIFAVWKSRIIYAPPDVWTAALALTSDKAEHRRRAQELFPYGARLFNVKGQKALNEGRADAALLAYWGLRFTSARWVAPQPLPTNWAVPTLSLGLKAVDELQHDQLDRLLGIRKCERCGINIGSDPDFHVCDKRPKLEQDERGWEPK